jgi:alkylation response protein AidB-like acyl-CoA dehydrogenase
VPAAAHGGQPGDLRDDHQPVRHRGAEARWLPGICDGTSTMAFAITEPDAGTNTHNITTTARRDGDEWVLNGRKIYISGVDEADNVLVVARTEDARTGKVKPVLFVVPTDVEGFEYKSIPMEIVSPELQFTVFMDDVRLPADAIVGDEDGGLVQLFAGLNPERIMAASFSTGLARFALTAPRRTPRSARCSRRPSAPTRPSRTRSRSPTSRPRWPG